MDDPKCSCNEPHPAHTYGAPLMLCKGIPRPDCDGRVTRGAGQCNECMAYHEEPIKGHDIQCPFPYEPCGCGALSNQPSVSAPEPDARWIPVSDSKPDYGAEVIVKLVDGSVLCDAIRQGDEDYWWRHKFFDESQVVAWQSSRKGGR